MTGQGLHFLHFLRRKAALITLILTAWPLLSLMVWGFVSLHQKIPDVAYVDLLLPSRWHRYRHACGEHYIQQAEALLKSNEVSRAVFQFQAGLARSPANSHGRVILSSLYAAFDRADLAQQVLVDGLPWLASEPAYLKAVFAYLQDHHQDGLIQQLTENLLQQTSLLSHESRLVLAGYAATAAYDLGQPSKAQAIIKTHFLAATSVGTEILASIDWDDGFPELAVIRIQQFLATHPAASQLRNQLNEYLHASGRLSEWQTSLIEAIAESPGSATARLALLSFYQLKRDEDRVRQESVRFLTQFRNDPAALLQFGDFAAQAGRPDLIGQITLPSTQTPEQAGALQLLLAEAQLSAGEYREALRLLEQNLSSPPNSSPTELAGPAYGLRAVACYALGLSDEARLHIEHLNQQENIRADTLVAIGRQLTSLGATDLAEAVLTRATTVDPLNQTALVDLITLELETDTLIRQPTHLERLLNTRKPPRDLLQRAQRQLGSDIHLLTPTQQPMLASLQHALAGVAVQRN